MGILDAEVVPDAPELPLLERIADLRARMVARMADLHYIGDGARASLLRGPEYDRVMRDCEKVAEHFDRAVALALSSSELIKDRVRDLTTRKS